MSSSCCPWACDPFGEPTGKRGHQGAGGWDKGYSGVELRAAGPASALLGGGIYRKDPREGEGLGDLGPGEPGEPGHGNPGQKDLGREDRERGDSGPRESPRPGSGSSRDRSSTRCHFSWTCCRGMTAGYERRHPHGQAGPGRSQPPSS